MSRREADQRDEEFTNSFARRLIAAVFSPYRARRGRLRPGRQLPRLVQGKEAAPAAGAPEAAAGGVAGRSYGFPTGRSTSTSRPARFREGDRHQGRVHRGRQRQRGVLRQDREPLKRNQSIDRDIVVLTDWMAGRMIRLGYVAPLDDRIPEQANVVDNVKA